MILTESDMESDTSLMFEESERVGDVFYTLTTDPENGAMSRSTMPTLNYGDKASVTVVRPASFYSDDEWMNAGDQAGLRIRDDIRENGYEDDENGDEENEHEAIVTAIIDHYRSLGWDAGEHLIGSPDHRVRVVTAAADGYGTSKDLADELDDWCNGRVYEVQAYKRVPWTDGHGGSFDSWMLADRMGGVYLTGDYDSWLDIAESNLDPDNPINPPDRDPDIRHAPVKPIGESDPVILGEADRELDSIRGSLNSLLDQIERFSRLSDDEGVNGLADRLKTACMELDDPLRAVQAMVGDRLDALGGAPDWDPSDPLADASYHTTGITR